MPADLQIQAQIEAPAAVQIRWLGDRRVVWAEFDAAEDGAVLSSTTSALFETAARTAFEQRLPLVMVLSTTGADIEEGLPALDGWGRLAAALARCSGSVPTIAVVDGPAVSGPALLLGLADLTVMTPSSYAFVNGPVMVEQFTGVQISIDELGGAGKLALHAGVPVAIVDDRAAAAALVEELLSYLPDHVDQEPPRWPSDDPADRSCPEAGELLPPTSTGSYDVRKVAAAIVDRARSSSCGRSGPPTWSQPSRPSTGGRSASSPTSRCRSPAPSTSPPARRRPGSWRSATPSTCP